MTWWWQRGLGAPPQWSERTALDPNHKPQCAQLPSSTVKKFWTSSPQERFVVSEDGTQIRKLTTEEVVALQGFPPGWFDVPGISDNDAVGMAGNAVPPPVGRAVFTALAQTIPGRTVLELFAGGGGLALGAEQAGFYLDALVDFWEPSYRALSANFDPERVIYAPVEDLDFSQTRVDVLSGGPPCQPFTSGGMRLGPDDPRDRCTALPLIVSEIEPEAFVFEEAKELLERGWRDYWRELVASFNRRGYSVAAMKINSHDYGVPQVRCRAFVAGFRSADPHVWADAMLAQASPGSGGIVADVLEEAPEEEWGEWEYGCRRPLTRRRRWCRTHLVGVWSR